MQPIGLGPTSGMQPIGSGRPSIGSAFVRPLGGATVRPNATMDTRFSGGQPPRMDPRPDSGVAMNIWLKDNHLNDKTVATLRDNGCDTMENLRSLHL